MDSSQTDIKRARRSGLIASFIFLIVGALQLWRAHTGMAIAAFILSAAFLTLAGFFTPVFIRVARFIGELITKSLLFIVYFIIVTPIGLTMKLLGKDPLEKRIETGRRTYWSKKEAVTEGVTRYEKQY